MYFATLKAVKVIYLFTWFESGDLWHDLLGYVNYNSRKLVKLKLLSSTEINKKQKCDICVEAKSTKALYLWKET